MTGGLIGDEADAPTTNVFSKLKATYIESVADLPQSVPLVVLAQVNGRYVQGDVSLKDFTHPTDAIYLFGNDVEWVTSEELVGHSIDHLVYIPTDTGDDMWSWAAYVATAWDRVVKSG